MRHSIRFSLAIALTSIALNACGGGGTSTQGLVPAPASSSTTVVTGASPTATPAPGSSATPTPAPGSTATPTPAPGSTATPTPAPGSSATQTPAPGSSSTPTARPTNTPVATPTPGGGITPKPTATPVPTATPAAQSPFAIPTSPPQAPGYTNVVPTTPAKGTCRAGQTYNIYILTPTGDREAFTVFEPSTICGATQYPLVMWGPGYSSSRMTSDASSATSVLSPGNIASLVNDGYGVVSIDERGFGEDTGTVRSMDPNFEGLMDLSVMDWAEANLNWIKWGTTLEGDDHHEPVMGAIGGSYGGMYQLMLLDIDKRHRLQAIVPQITPNDLNYSLYPNAVVKDAWGTILYGAGETGGSGISRGNEDPFLMQAFTTGLTANAESPAVHDFFGYHSNSYFCNGTSIATDGNAGSTPLFAPNHPPKINAMMWNGMRDTLFTFNNALNNYNCLKQGGGDVRLFSYQSGHNTLQAVPDPYMYEYYSATDDLDSKCGSLSVDTATVAFFDQYLKGKQGAASMLPTEPCLSIVAGDAVLVPQVTTGTAGTHFSIPSTAEVGGSGEDVPVALTLGPKFTSAGIIAGLPRISITMTDIGVTSEPFLFFGIGQMHASQPGNWDLLDNQITPVRGAGLHNLDMTGIAARVQPGDQLALLVFGGEDQYDAAGDINVAKPAVVPMTIKGDIWLPMVTNTAVKAP